MTERQQRILEFIAAHTEEWGFPPTIREIGNAVGISSTSVCNYHLNKLQKAGHLTRAPYVSRGLTIVRDDDDARPVPVALGSDVVVVIDGREHVGAFARLAA